MKIIYLPIYHTYLRVPRETQMYMYLDGILFGIVCELSIHSEPVALSVLYNKKKIKTRALYVFKNKENVLKYKKKYIYYAFYLVFEVVRFDFIITYLAIV